MYPCSRHTCGKVKGPLIVLGDFNVAMFNSTRQMRDGTTKLEDKPDMNMIMPRSEIQANATNHLILGYCSDVN